MKRLLRQLLCGVVCIAVLFSTMTGFAIKNIDKVDGTAGTPLGGFGTGSVKFNAQNGSFAITTRTPVRDFDYGAISGSKFQFYSNANGKIETTETMTAVNKDGRYDDDAIYPEHIVNFGEKNGIKIDMTAFSPLDNKNFDNMSMPYAFYEITVTNNNSAAADAAVALLWNHSPGVAEYVVGKGFKSSKYAVHGKSDDSGAVITSGSDGGFLTNGECNNSPSGTANKTAVKVSLNAGETKKIKLVLSWYDDSASDAENGMGGCYYISKYNNPGDIADLGLVNFETLEENASKLVNIMRGSNIPSWYVNQCLNSLINITTNSIYREDGRTAFSEGQWSPYGTMDQTWYARKIMSQICPQISWQELEYWARTQRNDGQIHHDFNYDANGEASREMWGWDDTEHPDYRNIDSWVDLNCAFITTIYETYQLTGDQDKLDYFWPYIKKAAARVLVQVEKFGNPQYPYTFNKSQNSYDAGGNPNPFNASFSAAMYKVMLVLCDKYGDTELKNTYQTAYDTVIESYRKRYLSNNFVAERISESYFGGQWLALNMKLGQIWTEEESEYVIDCLDSYYHPLYKGLSYTSGTYDEWTPYLLNHYGGLLLHSRRNNQYEFLQKDSYNRQYLDRQYVFNHPLDILPVPKQYNFNSNEISSRKQYTSIPTIWRNYNDVVGYYRDASTKDFWATPKLLSEMNHVMTNGAFISPEGYGTISFEESGKNYQNQAITIKSENPIEVSTLHISDYFGDSTENITVTVNGNQTPFTRSGEGYSKELLINYNGIIDSSGVTITAVGDSGKALPTDPPRPTGEIDQPVVPEKSAFDVIEAADYSAAGGVDIATAADGSKYVTNCTTQDYIKYDAVGFGLEGSEAISLKLSSELSGCIVEVALDYVSGDTLTTVEVPNTGGGEHWQDVVVDFPKVITGTHNVILRFYGPNVENLMNLKQLTFKSKDYKQKLDRTIWSATASSNGNSAKLAFDNDAATRWYTKYQNGGEWFNLDLGGTFNFDKIILDNSNTRSNNDYPRGYEVYVSKDGKDFGNAIAAGVGTVDKTEITFGVQNARYIKIVQTGQESSKYWSIIEMYVLNTVGVPTATPKPTVKPTAEPTTSPTPGMYVYNIDDASFDNNGMLNIKLKYIGAEANPTGKLIVASYNDQNILADAKIFNIKGTNIENFSYTKPESGTIKLYIWDSADKLTPLAATFDVK